MDALLAKHLAGQAEAGGACSAAPSPAGGCIGPRAMSRLLAAARKAREVLSVNTEAAAQVTDLVPGRDFSTTVTRAQFEDLAREIVERAAKPAARVLRSYPAGIDAIELVGGASRTPLFQALLRQAVSAATGRDLPLGRHVNTDEAVALGAALRAANVTAAVKDGRAPPRAALQDISPFTLRASAGAAGSAELVRAGGAIPASRTVSIANVTRDLEITIDTLIGTAEPSPEESVAFKVRGVAEAAARAAGKRGKGRGGGRAAAAPSVDVELRLSVSRSGIAAVDKVFAHSGKSFREALEVQLQAEGSPRLEPEQLRRSKLLLKEIERAEARRAAADEWRSSLEGLLFEVQTELDESEALRTLSNSAGKQDAIENFQAPELWSQCSDNFPQEVEPLLERTSLSRAGSALEQEIRLTEQWLWEVDEAGVALKVAEFEAKAQKLRESRDQFREAKRLASQTGSEDLQSYTATDEDLYSKLEIRELREKLEAVEQRVQTLEKALQQCVSNKSGS
uniref:Hypoxia up-regulated protein 1 isoform x4 n=1 Tax=Tetraselmis sp. GSL018 TaxID=582737 RepID=A0A061QLC0_9CHLO